MILHLDDYIDVCKVLFTPAEIAEYFEFRDKIITNWENQIEFPSEQALVGQYLRNDAILKPNETFLKSYSALSLDYSDFDISYFLKNMGDRIAYGDEDKVQYYEILKEMAMLNRTDLKYIKSRIKYCMKVIKEKRFVLPTRFATEKCGFLFLPIEKELISERFKIFRNLSISSKYEFKIEKHIGLLFWEDGETLWIDWSYLEGPWKHDADIEKFLKDNYPFRKTRAEKVARYSLSE